jgi:hypothetical protein
MGARKLWHLGAFSCHEIFRGLGEAERLRWRFVLERPDKQEQSPTGRIGKPAINIHHIPPFLAGNIHDSTQTI